jgi:hypothetical protein
VTGAPGTILTVVLLVGLMALIGYQVYMLRWTAKTTGSVPGTIKVLRSVNIVLLAVGTVLIVWALTR